MLSVRVSLSGTSRPSEPAAGACPDDAAEHDVGRRVAVVLLGGRAAMRGGQWIAGGALLAIWGADAFAPYAAALGLTGWLLTLSASGTEKAALTLLPTFGGAALRRRLLLIAVTPLAVAVLVGALAAPWADARTVWPAAVYSTALGLTMVLAAMLRLDRRPAWDVGAFVGIGTAHVATIAVARWTGSGPVGVLWLLAGAACTAALVTYVAVAARRAPVERRALPGRARTVETVALMGAVEVVNTVGIAIVYAILRRQAAPAETSTLYIALLLSQAITGAYLYLLRLVVPRTAVRGAAAPVRATVAASVLARRTALVSAVPAGVATVVAWSFTGTGVVRWLLIGALVIAGVAVFASVSYASLLLETRDASGRRAATLAAVMGMAGVAGIAVALVGRAGAVGALVAMLGGSVVHAVTLWLVTRRAASATGPCSA